MPKESYDDEAKGRWRHQWRKFTKHISKSPRDTKVVFLPGRQALELFEVYDQRGIPRSNIIGIERDKDIYDHLKSQRLGIELFHGTDTEFFEHADGKFDIVNLDYDGTYNASVQRSLELMAGRQLLKSPSVLGVTICGKREQNSSKHLYKSILFTNYLSQLRLSEGEEDFAKSANTLFDLATIGEDQILKEAERFGYKRGELRDKMITEMIMSTLYGGREGVEPHPLLNKVPEPNKTRDKMDSIWRRFDIREVIIDALKKADIAKNERAAHILSFLVRGVWDQPYIPTAIKRYRYESSGGTSMVSDFLLLDQRRDVFKKYEYLAEKISGNLDFADFALQAYGLVPTSQHVLTQIVNIVKEDYLEVCHTKTPERIFLGSSYKSPLSGKEYYQLSVIEGKTDEEIRQLHRSTSRQMTAFKAHVTMGRYGPVPKKTAAEMRTITTPVQVEQLNPREFSLPDIISRKYSKRLSENSKLRMQYFIQDLFGIVSEKDMEKTLGNIKESRWYRNVEKEKPSDTRVYSFFDDLTICARNGYVPSIEDVNRIYRAALSGQMDNKVREFVTTQKIPEKQKLTWKIYHELREQGKGDEEISKEYGATTHQLSAYKAWNTMKTRPEPIKSEGAHTESKLGIAIHHPNFFIDSRGYPHTTQGRMLEAERGYRD